MCDIEISEIIRAIARVRVSATPGEYDIHALIASALADAGIVCAHECRLGARSRIDFLCGDIGVEIKKGKPDKRALLSQLEKYLKSPKLRALVLVLPRDIDIPEEICGKPIARVSLNRLWGVALP